MNAPVSTDRIITAHFWVFVNEGFVRLSLKDGQSIEHTTGGPTDEGYYHDCEKWTRDGEIIIREFVSWEADCDGRFETHSTPTAHIEELERNEQYEAVQDDDGWHMPESGRIICLTPEWVRGRSGQRDYSAEAAGY